MVLRLTCQVQLVIGATAPGAEMPAEYVIQKNLNGKHSVTYRQLFSKDELEIRFTDLVRNGWPFDDARAEIDSVNTQRKFCNENPDGYGLAVCLEFVASYVAPGDVVVVLGHVFVVNTPSFEVAGRGTRPPTRSVRLEE
jgi:hypothetical protein